MAKDIGPVLFIFIGYKIVLIGGGAFLNFYKVIVSNGGCVCTITNKSILNNFRPVVSNLYSILMCKSQSNKNFLKNSIKI